MLAYNEYPLISKFKIVNIDYNSFISKMMIFFADKLSYYLWNFKVVWDILL